MRWHHHLCLLALVLACSSRKTEYKVPAFAQFPCPVGTHPDVRNVGGEVFRTCADAQGNFEGPSVSWDLRTGAISSKRTYRHGKPSGTATNYHANGKILSVGEYVDGVQNGEWRIWDEDGNLKVIDEYYYGKLIDEKMFPAPDKKK